MSKYCSQLQTPFGMKIVGSKNAKELKERLSDFVLRRTRSQVFGRDLQPPTMLYVQPPSGKEARELRELEELKEGKAILRALEAGGLQGLKKIEGQVTTVRRMIGLAKVPGVTSIVSDELLADVSAKIVVGAYHTEVIDKLAAGLKGWGAVIIDGRASRDEKEKRRLKFQKDQNCRVIVGQLHATGVGVDLSAADDALIVEPDWVHDNNAQFFSRVFNSEKLRPCFARYAVLPGSIDEAIMQACTRKANDNKKLYGA